MWKELIALHCRNATFGVGVGRSAIADAEAQLLCELPDQLAELLRESNGVAGEYGLGLVWPLERIVRDNLAFRADAEFPDLYMPFDPLLFFADGGNGDQFAFAIRRGGVTSRDIYAWNHEDDSRTWVAPSLDTYIEWWLTGRIAM